MLAHLKLPISIQSSLLKAQHRRKKLSQTHADYLAFRTLVDSRPGKLETFAEDFEMITRWW
jgi:hypothetical protein